jgi:glycosyltransferase involved in cell wall biosynthesis
MTKVLFCLKFRDNHFSANDIYSSTPLSSGLMNSASFVKDMLLAEGYDAELVHCVDNNFIDREVNKYKPDIVVIEAYWVVPEKFEILHKLHPKVKWVIRNHSATPFLATEGQIIDWSLRYLQYKNVYVSSNDKRTNEELRALMRSTYPLLPDDEIEKRTPYLPNFYPTLGAHRVKVYDDDCDALHICCFGAIRPLKNQLIQAVAAIQYADEHDKTLHFHINGGRIEGNGAPILKNIRKLFENVPHKLVEHDWLPHDEFLQLMRTMDLSMQVSYSETFNIVTADAVYCGVPVVTSNDVQWISRQFHADPNNSIDIYNRIHYTLGLSKWPGWMRFNPNLDNLIGYNARSTQEWSRFLDGEYERERRPFDFHFFR